MINNSNMIKFILLLVFLAVGCLAFPGRIVNGSDAYPGEFPYIVSIQYSGGRHNCGGSILDPTHILTAAHCIYDYDEEMFIQYGIVSITESINRIKVINGIYHEGYDPEIGHYHDIAVLTLESKIQLSDIVRTTELPEQGEPTPENAPSVLAGWGYDYTEGEVQEHLQRVDLKVYTDDECEHFYENRTNSIYNICSGIDGGGKGQCSGDSGGPLYSNGKQVGVVSWSKKPCALEGYPGVYVKVSTYIDWIHDHM